MPTTLPKWVGMPASWLTAHIPLNSVRYVCAAPAGIRTSVDLPRIIPQLG
jgi:hypothetical protein